MRGYRVTWTGGYTDVSDAALTAYHDGLQSQFGFTPVGVPIRRTFPTGVVAAAFYREALIVLFAAGGVANIQALIRARPSLAALATFTKATFGLSDERVMEDDAEL